MMPTFVTCCLFFGTGSSECAAQADRKSTGEGATRFSASSPQVPQNYVLGPDDQIVVQGVGVEEISSAPVRIDMRGDVNFPMIGRVHAAGLTSERL